jgi:hypothetical protein
MRADSHRPQVLAAFRTHFEKYGRSPTCRQLGLDVGISAVAAWKNVQALIYDRKLLKNADGSVSLADWPADLSTVPTGKLRGELARRGVTLDALKEPKLLWDEGRPCAANHCPERVRRGHLMCRDHWLSLPIGYRRDILTAWGARQVQAYQEAVERARDYHGGFTRVVERVG